MIFVILVLIIICIILGILLSRKVELDRNTLWQNENIAKQNVELSNTHNYLQFEVQKAQETKNRIEDDITRSSNILNNLSLDNEKIANEAYSKYVEILEERYNEAEMDFDTQIRGLCAERFEVQRELDKLKATRAAAHKAMLREQEVKEDKDNYRLIPSDADLADSRRLEIVKRELNKPRILCMLIWQTYWQPLAKKQFPLIIKNKTTCGIYKITNLITDECYIGQAVDVYKRWCEHCKCGLGIDTPPGNKLYKAIQEYGLNNFTFEVLEECSSNQLNEKEKYFIELYQADTFGYNGNKGVK